MLFLDDLQIARAIYSSFMGIFSSEEIIFIHKKPKNSFARIGSYQKGRNVQKTGIDHGL